MKCLIVAEELFVIVEYCKFGNLQKYIEKKRESFISQINPATGRFEETFPPNIDKLLSGYDRFDSILSRKRTTNLILATWTMSSTQMLCFRLRNLSMMKQSAD